MNIPTLLIAAGIGIGFLAVEHRWFLQPDLIKPEVAFDFLSTDHMKARDAVRHRLVNPASAQFGELRTIDSEGARFVCGGVKAKDKSGQFVDAAFVYTVANDFARLDDDGRLTFQQVAYKPCPASDDEKIAQQKALISPGALSVIKAAQKVAPKNADPSVLTTLSSITPSGGGSSGETMQQQLGQFAGQPAAGGAGPAGGASSSGGAGSPSGSSAPGSTKGDKTVEASLPNERDWRADQPPAAWPGFPADHPLARPAAKRTPAQALALAKDIEERWERSKSRKNDARRPSLETVRDVCRALLTIDPKDKEYPKAWAAFVRLRGIEREMTA